MYHWYINTDKYIAAVENAHELSISRINYHPLGHLLATSSYDQTCKFWTTNRPGDEMTDKYNISSLPESVEKRSAVELLMNAAQLNPQSMGRRTMEMDLFTDYIQQHDITNNNDQSINSNDIIPGLGSYKNAKHLQHQPAVQLAPQQQSANSTQYTQYNNNQQQQYSSVPVTGNVGAMNPARLAMIQQQQR